ncbi:MAG: sulfatase family protein [Thermoleophilaceae bacterium]
MARVVGSLCLALALLLQSGTALAARPNILVVMTDDQSAQGTMAVMPETSRLIGGSGTTFLEAHATTPSCCPSRASFFTGRYVHNHRVTSNTVPERLDQRTTLQYFLQRRGYRTALFGKYLNSWRFGKRLPHFDDYAHTTPQFEGASWNFNGRIFRNVQRYNTDVISDLGVKFIRRSERKDRTPWLAWLTPLAPHLPSTPAPRHQDAPVPPVPETPALAEGNVMDKPDFLDNARGYPEMIETVRDDGRRSLMAVDEMVARLVRELKRKRELKNTLVVFTSDNGVMLGEHGGVAGKDLPYRAATQIPLLVRWDRHVRAGATRTDLVSNVDVATTLMRAAGVKRRTDGKSLFSKGRRSELFLEHFGAKTEEGDVVLAPWNALRTPSFRYAEYLDRPGGSVTFREYYDLNADPWELDNQASTLSPGRVAELSGRLQALSRCKRSSCP